jgi:hypothetical protein
MLPWFVENFQKHNPNAELMIYDFGMEGNHYPKLRKSLRVNHASGWFKKPAAMLKASKLAKEVCWLDTDCWVRGNLDNIFSYLQDNKLGMVRDEPWTMRTGQVWHNSGVVAFRGTPEILKVWEKSIGVIQERGDQEVLHAILGTDPLKRLIHITDLPNQYNTLRLQFIDGTAPPNPKIVHWTGPKGKMKIRELMNEGH